MLSKNRGVKFISKLQMRTSKNRTERSGEKLAPRAHTNWADDWEEQVDRGATTCSQSGHAIQRINYSSPGDPGHRTRIEEKRSQRTR